MNLLAIDTSTERASIALFANNVMHTREHENIKQHAKYILPLLDELLVAANIDLSGLDGIVYGSGPGSFTGIRVTCSVDKALEFAKNLPLYPVSSLKAIAYAASTFNISENIAVLAMLDAKMDEVYWQFFQDFTHDNLDVSKAENINIFYRGPIILAGVGLETYASRLSDSIKNLVESEQVIYPLAEVMIRLVLDGKIKSENALDASPVYVRNQVVGG